jgi:hypothetical protein
MSAWYNHTEKDPVNFDDIGRLAIHLHFPAGQRLLMQAY